MCVRAITLRYRTNAVNTYLVLLLLLSPATLTVKSGANLIHKEKTHTAAKTNSYTAQTFLYLLLHRWHVAGKSECSAKCGPGYRSLDVQCMKYSLMKRQSERVDASTCGDVAKPQTRETCHGDCLLKSWQYSAWSQVWGIILYM